jgi:tetratricopeptide (TPR) repeat protein
LLPRPSALALVSLASLLALGGCAGLLDSDVVRRVHGRDTTGRFIGVEAYAAYTEGALAEASGAPVEAEKSYERAASLDDGSADIWARLGAVRCVRGVMKEAASAFEKAAAIDASFAPVWLERALCLGRDDASEKASPAAIDAALASALQAVTLDPGNLVASLLVARLEERRGNLDGAAAWLEGLWARDPDQPVVLAALGRFASEHDRPALLARTQRRRDTHPAAPAALHTDAHLAAPRVLEERPAAPAGGEHAAASPPGAGLGSVDRALAAGDLPLARRLALRTRVASGALALRAAAIGKHSIAREQAALVLAADPASTDARVALLVAADVERDAAALSQALSGVPAAPPRPSPLATLMLAEVLLRRSGPDAARAALGAGSPLPSGNTDPLLARIAQRVEARLSP